MVGAEMDDRIMIAGKHNFVADFGQRFETIVTVLDDQGDPINWNAWTGNLTLADPNSSGVALVEAAVSGNDDGEITIVIAEDDWVESGTFKYDLRMQNGTDVQFVLTGSFTVRETVTTA
jgi:hypothetical protein